MFIYVILDVYKPANKYMKRGIYEKKITKGPYTKLHRGIGGDIEGVTPDGDTELIFAATVGSGGYCDSCAYDYPDFGMNLSEPYYDVEVKHFEIEIRDK